MVLEEAMPIHATNQVQRVFKIKYGGDGEVERHKARLVACKYLQIQHVDYFETQVKVSSKALRRMAVKIADELDREDEAFDVPTSYCQAILDILIDMELPRGCIGQVDGVMNLFA